MNKSILLILSLLSVLFAGRVDVCIDPGHGGVDPGAVNPRYGQNGPYEKDFNHHIAWTMVGDLYWVLGYSVSMTRFADEFVPLEHRADMANGKRVNPYTNAFDTCEYFVSVHNNGNVDRNVHGTETYYKRKVDEYFANCIHVHMWNYISMFLYAEDRGVFQKNFYVLRNVTGPACLTEGAFVTHDIASTAQWFQLKDNQGGFKDYMAYGIDDGIDSYYEFPRPGWLKIIHVLGERATINLEWVQCPVSVTGYNIYRRTHPNENFDLIENNYPNTSYTDNGVTSGGIYSYYVKGVNNFGQEGNRSNIATAQIKPFSSDYSIATGLNNTKKVVSDNNGLFHFNWTNLEGVWYTKSTDYGNSWSVAPKFHDGWQSALDINTLGNIYTCYLNTLGTPDPGTNDPLIYTVAYSCYENDTWYHNILYETPDSILSISFAIDPLDTGWVVFNTYDDEGNNELKIGQFYTQTLPESLENVTTLDTYNSYGKAAVVVRSSDGSIWIVYERNNTIVCKWRQSNGNWWTILIQQEGIYPCLSIVNSGDLIHFIWEKYYSDTDRREIQTIYTNGLFWPRVQTIAVVSGENCYPYIEKGSIAVWADFAGNQWDVYSSQRTESGDWTTPQNISQTLTDSKYPQVAMYQTVSQTNLVYVWTEGNESPYEVKILPVSLRSNPVPFYAFNLGEKEPSVFLKHRSGYVVYEEGFEKSADYDTSFLHYKITGLDPDKIYHLGLVFYQDEANSVWQQEIAIDNCLIKKINLPRKKIINEKIVLSQEDYQDGIIELKIKKLSGPKVVLSAMSVWEFSKENHPALFVKESSMNVPQEFNVLTLSNPVKDKSLFHYQLPKACQITIKIYSISGQLVREIKENKSAGLHTTIWDGKDTKGIDIASGIYFYRVESTNKTVTGKIIFLR
jgi:N-acetylmuramoyl-L-alanine amidase